MRLDGRQTGLTSPTPTICFLELTLSSLKPCSEKLLVYLTCDLCNFSTLSVMCARCEKKGILGCLSALLWFSIGHCRDHRHFFGDKMTFLVLPC